MRCRRVEVLVVPGCPHARAAVDLVEQVLAQEGIAATVEVTTITTPLEAQARGFIGSPTILIDGVDCSPEADARPGLACRVYPTSQGLAGVPEAEKLAQALARGADSGS